MTDVTSDNQDSHTPLSITDKRLTTDPAKSLKLPSLHSEKLSGTESLQRGCEEGDDEKGDECRSEVWGVEGKASVDLSLKVRSLTVTFNKPEHPLAQGVVSELVAKVETRRGNLQLSGKLGQASVVDLTETGAYYRERYALITDVRVQMQPTGKPRN